MFYVDEPIDDFSDKPLKEFRVSLIPRCKAITEFIEKWHYSHNINGLMSRYCFVLSHEDNMIGVMIYGDIAMSGVYKKYVENQSEIIELRRLCCVDKTPKNTESYFIGYTLRWLRNNTKLKKVISYSDLQYGHSGGIYKASNFKYFGQSSPGKVIWYNGKRYHDKTIRTKYRGDLKPFAQKIKDALECGDAYYEDTKPKNVWIYDL